MSDSESDIEIKSALPKKMAKRTAPPSPTENITFKKLPKKMAVRSPSDDSKNNNKKISTKVMIIDALAELKTRKGVSLYAIKKHLTEKYNVNTEKVNYLIKKSIKAGVEDGTFIQMKGIGASGSFKLANVKEKPKTKKTAKNPKNKTEKDMSEKKEKMPEVKKPKKIESKKIEKGDEKKLKKKVEKVENKPKKVISEKVEMKTKKSKVKITKGMQTPAKKRAAMSKRRSIGSIIKPPKMKPKLQA